jgi:hypothetical protein
MHVGSLTASQCEFSDNTVTDGGGALFGSHGGGISVVGGDPVRLKNSTVSGNSTAGSGGGVYFNQETLAAAVLTLENCTVAFNSAGDYGGGVRRRGLDGVLELHNSLISNNTSNNGPDCDGTVESLGYNLIQDLSDCTVNGDLTGVLTGVDPLLGPLESIGGHTRTHELAAGSPALDAGDPASYPGQDQRGVLRPSDGNCSGAGGGDLGALERALALDADPEAVSPGDTLTFTTVSGKPGGLAMLAVVDVSGVSLFFNLGLGVLGVDGRRTLMLGIPPGLEGLEMTFLALGTDACDKLAVSNSEVVVFED